MYQATVLQAVLLFAFALTATVGSAQGQQKTTAQLTNKDVLDIYAAGLSTEIIIDKIKSSHCVFDTAPDALVQLKSAGVPDPVILAVLHCETSESEHPATSGTTEPPKPAEPDASATLPKGYSLTYVKSDRKWKLGLRSEPYNKISEYFEKELVAALDQKGFHRLPSMNGSCCEIVIELLVVTSHPAMIKNPGVDVSGNLSVTDAGKSPVYGKGYRGEARTMMNTWGHMIDHAVEDMVKNIVADEALIKFLSSGERTGDGTFIPSSP